MSGPWTRDEILRAIELHEKHGLTWREVEARTGRSRRSLMTTVCRFRSGKWGTPTRDRSRQIEAEVEALIASGVISIAEIARRLGFKYMAMYMRLKKMGLDSETIREAADMARMVA